MTNELRAVDIHIVDDDADVRDGLAWLFDSRGWQTRTWAGGPELLAAVQPAQTRALYFVAKGDGSSHFSPSLDEHNRAVNQYQ